MKLWLTLLMTVAISAFTIVGARQLSPEEQRALRTRLEERFDIVPLTDGLALRPKTRQGDLRLIEIADGTITVNGVPVTGRELRDRLKADAEAVLRVSYLSAEERRALVATGSPQQSPQPEVERSRTDEQQPGSATRKRRSTGDRVRIFGSVEVNEDEEVTGNVVAVMGSVRVAGEVGQEVVAVLGSVHLGPNAVVRGDTVSVGGQVRREPGAQIRGAVTEVSLGDPAFQVTDWPWPGSRWGRWHWVDGFGAVPRLIGSTFRWVLLVLLTWIALVVARTPVERAAQRVSDTPVKAVLVGLAAQLLIGPVLLLTAFVLAISIIGIPLLLLLPFVILLVVLMALVGFSGTACAVGQWARRRFNVGTQAADVALGVLIILSPVLAGRVVALAGWPVTPIAWLLISTGFAIEFLAWSSGLGAVLTNAFTRWQARRAVGVAP
jgi:hypothetical protein